MAPKLAQAAAPDGYTPSAGGTKSTAAGGAVASALAEDRGVGDGGADERIADFRRPRWTGCVCWRKLARDGRCGLLKKSAWTEGGFGQGKRSRLRRCWSCLKRYGWGCRLGRDRLPGRSALSLYLGLAGGIGTWTVPLWLLREGEVEEGEKRSERSLSQSKGQEAGLYRGSV